AIRRAEHAARPDCRVRARGSAGRAGSAPRGGSGCTTLGQLLINAHNEHYWGPEKPDGGAPAGSSYYARDENKVSRPFVNPHAANKVACLALGRTGLPRLDRSEVGSDRRRPDKEGFGLAMSKRRRDRRSAGLARLA